MSERLVHNLKSGIGTFCVFFLLVAFVVTCCFVLFINVMQDEMALTLTQENLELAAKMTFANVLLLSLVFSVIDRVRRRYTVEKPVQEILAATDKVMHGDFSVRIPEPKSSSFYGFTRIIRNFNAMTAELSGTETLRTDFVADVSHELKTPLAVMQNYGTMLQQPGLSEEKRVEYAKIITGSSRRLAELITNILKLNRLENQQIFPEFQEYDKEFLDLKYFSADRYKMLTSVVNENTALFVKAGDIILHNMSGTAEVLKNKAELTSNPLIINIARSDFTAEDGYPAGAAALLEDVMSRVSAKTAGMTLSPMVSRNDFSEEEIAQMKTAAQNMGYKDFYVG